MSTLTRTHTQIAGGVSHSKWTITGTNDGAPESVPDYPHKSVGAYGTWGGGTITIEESNDGTNYWTSTEISGGAATLTSDGSIAIVSHAKFHRPRGTTSVTSVVVEMTSIKEI